MDKVTIARFKSLGKPVPFWWRVAYLIPDIFRQHVELEEGFVKVIGGKDVAFNRFVQGHISAYIEKGTMPPEAITGPILNMAEDVMAGREPTIRAGDYIALQNFRRAQ